MTWTEGCIGDFAEIRHGFAFKGDQFSSEGAFIVITPGNCYENGGFRSRGEKEKFYSGPVPEGYLLNKGDVLVVMTDLVNSAPVLGGSFSIPEDNRYLHNQRLGLVHITRPDLIDGRFLYHLFNTHKYRAQVRGSASGATVRHTSPGRIKSCKVKYPTSLGEQKRIAETVSAYDDLIENNRKRIALLEEAARLLYREWFVHFRFPGHEHVKLRDGVPEGWVPRTLDDVVELVDAPVKPADFAEDDVHIGLEHIPRRSFTLAEWESAKGLASGKIRFLEGDILFAKIRPYFHKVGFALRAGLASSDALVWRVLDEKDWPLVLCATSSDHFVAVASKTVREGSKMPRADWKVLKKYAVPKPPEGTLATFNETIRPITAQCKALALQNRALAKARDLLLPRLMNGEVAV
jgi:type I restriction enzyme, S subunit